MGIWAYAKKNMAKWGIPEKSIKNAAQKRLIQVRRTFHSKVTKKSLGDQLQENVVALMIIVMHDDEECVLSGDWCDDWWVSETQ